MYTITQITPGVQITRLYYIYKKYLVGTNLDFIVQLHAPLNFAFIIILNQFDEI